MHQSSKALPPHSRIRHALTDAVPAPALLINAVLLTAVLIGGFVLLKNKEQIGDEVFHLDQIRIFLRGDWAMNASLTTIPGYHFVIAGIAKMGGWMETWQIRLISFFISILTIPLFLRIALDVDRSTAAVRTLQFAFLPILFPLFFLLYTDPFSLLMILACLLSVCRRRYAIAGIYAFAAVCVRQNLFAWLQFFLGLTATDTISSGVRKRLSDNHLLVARIRDTLQTVRWRLWLVRSLPLLLIIPLFGIFAYVNGGVAIGDQTAHPFPSVHTGNLFFAIFLLWLLLLPVHLANSFGICRLLRKHGNALFFCLSLVFVVYWFTFFNTHPYNQPEYDWWLRNRLVIYFTQNDWYRGLFFLPIVHCLLSLAATPLLKVRYVLLYPVTVLYLLPSWLIEQRYYIVPYTFFLLFRRHTDRGIELLQVLYLIVFSAVLLMGIEKGKFFL